jgi:hypothetical protein
MNDILTGWKLIAAYLGVDPKTSMRYRKNLKLPVTTDSKGRATTTKQMLDKWRFGDAMPEYYLDADR